MDIEEQYDKIYRYCFFRLRDRSMAEDVTQETFLRWLASDTYRDRDQTLRYLYTVARHLCSDENASVKPEPLSENVPARDGDTVLCMALKTELEGLSDEDRELVMLRFANGVPVNVLAGLYGVSRFTLYRRLRGILKRLRNGLEG